MVIPCLLVGSRLLTQLLVVTFGALSPGIERPTGSVWHPESVVKRIADGLPVQKSLDARTEGCIARRLARGPKRTDVPASQRGPGEGTLDRLNSRH